MSRFTVAYHAATYSGQMTVEAEDEDQAIAIVRARVRHEMSLPMYYESYRVVNR
jgi:hypothetical protein